jgi:AcrR family transcriptional regulator
MSARVTPAGPRAVRGDPVETRRRLVLAAADVFNTSGYQGTDSNAIARHAGYSPGTFYKHFLDKRAVFLAVYESWVSAEWTAIEPIALSTESASIRARRLVALTTELHRRWRGFRASLRALVAWDDEVRAFHRKQRRRQLQTMAKLREARGRGKGAVEADALLLFTLERVCDAIADGETSELGLRTGATTRLLEQLVEKHLS